MTKRHFEAIARIFREQREGLDASDMLDPDSKFAQKFAVARTARDMADYFETENPRFDRERFLTACGLTS